jgi:hypothetical protein
VLEEGQQVLIEVDRFREPRVGGHAPDAGGGASEDRPFPLGIGGADRGKHVRISFDRTHFVIRTFCRPSASIWTEYWPTSDRLICYVSPVDLSSTARPP